VWFLLVLELIVAVLGWPEANMPKFSGRLLEQWNYLNKVEFVFARPGKPRNTNFAKAFITALHLEWFNTDWSGASVNLVQSFLQIGPNHEMIPWGPPTSDCQLAPTM